MDISAWVRLIIKKFNMAAIPTFRIIATEAHDDDGLPHTLEHLVFMGSEEYPYKVKL